jgi:hypothetical protein
MRLRLCGLLANICDNPFQKTVSLRMALSHDGIAKIPLGLLEADNRTAYAIEKLISSQLGLCEMLLEK